MNKSDRHTLAEARLQYEQGKTLLEGKKELEKALILFQSVLEVFESEKKVYSTLLTYQKIGETYTELFNTKEAIANLEKAYTMLLHHDVLNPLEKGLLLFSLSEAYGNIGAYRKDCEYMKQSLASFKEVLKEESFYISNCYNNLGFVSGQLGDYLGQLEYHQKNLPIRLRLFGENHTKTGVTYNNLGISYACLGDYQRAKEAFEHALRIQKQVLKTELHPEIARLYNNISYCLNRESNWQKSLYYLQKALSIRRKILPAGHGEILQNEDNIASVYINLKKYDKALHILLEILRVNEGVALANQYAKHQTIQKIASCYNFLQQMEKVIEWGEKGLALSLANFGTQHPDTALSYNSLGTYYLHTGEPLKSIEYFEKALEIWQVVALVKHENLATTYFNLSEAMFLLKDYDNALTYNQKAIISSVFHFDNEDIAANPIPHQRVVTIHVFINVIIHKADLLFQTYLHNQQIKYLQLAAETYFLVDEYLSKFQKEQIENLSKLSLAEKAQSVYAATMKVVESCGRLNIRYKNPTAQNHKLFECSEKSKAFLLHQQIREVVAKNAALIDTKLLEKEQDLNFQLNALNLQLRREETKRDNANHHQIEKWQQEYLVIFEAHQALIQQFEQNYPDYYQLKYNTATAKIEEIQQALSSNYRDKPSNALMIAYFIGNEHLYLFGITSNVVEVRQVTKPSNFNQIVAGFNKAIRQIRKKKYLQLGFQLYQLLLQPILEQLSDIEKIEQLILIPHGILTTLPFEALLCSQPKSKSSYADFDYLLLHYDISYHYSATLWLHGLQQQKNKKILAESFIGFAPVYKDENPTTSTELVQTESYRSVSIGGNEYQALIYSEEEVQNVQQAFDSKGFISQTFLHKKATKVDFSTHVQEKKYVLIAAHGVHNKEQPELSGIIFSPQSNQTAEEAVLYVNDAYHLKLDADLVVLSSCESGIGKLAKGEGMMAINRGFLYAGASNVIFTLFKVYDQQSSQLTQLLFEAILEGKNYPQALRWAKLELIRQQGIDPKAWSGFVLIGG